MSQRETAGSLESAIDFEKRSLENLDSHSHLQNGSVMAFTLLERLLWELLRESAAACTVCVCVCAFYALHCP